VHPLAAIDYDRQIPKKGDQRQMEPWQRIGTYAAGLALADAAVAGVPELLAHTHMIVAAGGGERDVAVDLALVHDLATTNDTAPALNARLMADLRPTLFLAQLSNLLAGSISIVHGVRGSSRTLMGEEAAGADAARIAHARIAAGQAELALIGGGLNALRQDLCMLYGGSGTALRGPWRPVWQRTGPDAGFAMGSQGGFVVLEEAAHARARGARGLARLTAIGSDISRPGSTKPADAIWATMRAHRRPGTLGVISGATGVADVTDDERSFLASLAADGPIAARATGTRLGHGVEASFPLNLALAALALSHGGFYPPFEPGEAQAETPVRQILVTGFAAKRGQALALLEPLDQTGAP
jgi:3-oxoacyl-[acyl-carrier-protein] synthase II